MKTNESGQDRIITYQVPLHESEMNQLKAKAKTSYSKDALDKAVKFYLAAKN